MTSSLKRLNAAPWLVMAALLIGWVNPASAEFRIESLDNNFPEEIEAAGEEGKRLVLFFHQLGCPYCDKMRKRVLPSSEIIEFFSKKFVMIESNIKGNLEVVMPDGTEGTERDFAKKIRVRATPVFIFYDTDGTPALRTTGYMNPARFLLAGKYVSEGVHKSGKSFFRYVQEQN